MAAVINNSTNLTRTSVQKPPEPANLRGASDPKKIPTQFKNRVLISYKFAENAVAWCKENIKNRYHYDRHGFQTFDGDWVILYSFAKPGDAIAFKLLFGDLSK